MDELMPIIERPTDWCATIILIISTIITCLLITIRILFPDYHKLILYRMLVENLSGRQVEKHIDTSTQIVISSIGSLLSLSAMIFTAIYYSGKTNINVSYGNEWKVLLLTIAAILAYNICKLVLNKIIGTIFRLEPYTNSYNSLIVDTEKILGLVYLPIFLFCPFVSTSIANVLIWIALIITIIVIGFQFVTLFLHLLKNKFLNHYSFLYFCALEVLPILVIIKLLF